MRYILSLDQGTTSSRAMLFDHAGSVVAIDQAEVAQIYPKPGWVEHDAQEIWQSQLKTVQNCLKKVSNQSLDQLIRAQTAPDLIVSRSPSTSPEILAIGITNQRETTVLWDRATGQPLYNAIVWQDRRTAVRCDELRNQGHAELIQQKTGLVLDAYFSATKLAWLLDNVPGARARANKGELAFGTMD